MLRALFYLLAVAGGAFLTLGICNVYQWGTTEIVQPTPLVFAGITALFLVLLRTDILARKPFGPGSPTMFILWSAATGLFIVLSLNTGNASGPFSQAWKPWLWLCIASGGVWVGLLNLADCARQRHYPHTLTLLFLTSGAIASAFLLFARNYHQLIMHAPFTPTIGISLAACLIIVLVGISNVKQLMHRGIGATLFGGISLFAVAVVAIGGFAGPFWGVFSILMFVAACWLVIRLLKFTIKLPANLLRNL